MSVGLRRVGSALQDLTISPPGKEDLESPEKPSFKFCIMYSDDDTMKERDMKLYDFYKASFYTDVVLKVREESLSVHGIVLSAISEYFQVMLHSGFRESSSRIIDFSSSFQNVAVLKTVVDFMYTGKISLRHENFEPILGAAHLFLLNGLKRHCAQFLLEQLKPENALWTWRLAYLYDIVELESVCHALLLSVFSRQLIDQTDMWRFTPDCLSGLLNWKEFVKNLRPQDVAYMMIAWLRAGEFESRREVAKALLLKHLKDEALDAILESVSCQDPTNYELIPRVPNFNGNIDWSSSESSSSSQETLQAIIPCSPQVNFHGLLVYEEFCDGLSWFCRESNKWIYGSISDIGLTPLGIIESGHLVAIGDIIYTIHLTNLNTKHIKLPTPVSESIIQEDRLINTGVEATHYFIHLGRLYVLINLWSPSTSEMVVFSIYRLDESQNWTLLTDITQNVDAVFLPASFSRNDIRVKLTSVPHDGDTVFIIAKLSLTKARNSGGWDIDELNEPQCIYDSVYQRSICYLYKVNIPQGQSTRISTGHLNIKNSQLDKAFFFRQKLFLPEDKFDNWEMSSDLNIHCACYDFTSSDWCLEDLTLPSPEIEPLPLKGGNFPQRTVKIQGSLLYAGIHQAPHIFNVYVFDFDTFQWQKLPPIPSASVSKMALHPISSNRPISQCLTSNTSRKYVDNSQYFFLNIMLESWNGQRAKLFL